MKIKAKIKLTLRCLREFKLIKPILEKGHYSFNGKEIHKTHNSFGFLYNVSNKNKYSETITNAKVMRGKYKLCLITSDYTYAFLLKRDLFFNTKNKCEKFYNNLNYPKIKIIDFNEKYALIKMETAKGQRFNDDEHKNKILEKLINFYKEITIFKQESILTCVQHGDVTWGNIIWQNENDFVFIDLDSISIKPLFYDLFYFISLNMGGLKTLLQISDKLVNEFEEIFNKYNLHFEKQDLDKYLSLFVLSWKNNKNFNFIINWRNSKLLENFPITFNVIREINNAKL